MRAEEVDSNRAQINGLTLLHMANDKTFNDLTINVFPGMLSDEITRTAMGDYLIKYYGARDYRSHHLINSTSQRMRQLAKFLIALKNGDVKLKCLSEYLRPTYFEYLVEATMEMTGYDAVEQTFRSASGASKWAGILKDLCDAAMFVATRQNNCIGHKEVKNLSR